VRNSSLRIRETRPPKKGSIDWFEKGLLTLAAK